MYTAYVKRKVVEEVDMRRITAISALHGNSAYLESEKGPELMRARIEHIEESANDAIRSLYSAVRAKPTNDDPYGFFAAGDRGLKKMGLKD